MKFKIVVEDKKKGKIEIKLPERKIHRLFDIMYMVEGSDAVDTIKLNKDIDTFNWFHKITDHLVIDIIEGGLYKEKGKKTIYLTKKPLWRKQRVIRLKEKYL